MRSRSGFRRESWRCRWRWRGLWRGNGRRRRRGGRSEWNGHGRRYRSPGPLRRWCGRRTGSCRRSGRLCRSFCRRCRRVRRGGYQGVCRRRRRPGGRLSGDWLRRCDGDGRIRLASASEDSGHRQSDKYQDRWRLHFVQSAAWNSGRRKASIGPNGRPRPVRWAGLLRACEHCATRGRSNPTSLSSLLPDWGRRPHPNPLPEGEGICQTPRQALTSPIFS